ncbi:MAG: LysR family transcriptional regulator [Bdellovibrionota bacterium]
MIIDRINLNHLRIFECVYRTKSMTIAAKELHLTQSGVSQHIKSLEDAIGLRLFDRIKLKLIPTHHSDILFKQCVSLLGGLENVISKITGAAQELAGTIHIGMPVEFGNNIILPLLASLSKEHPRLQFSVTYGLAMEMNRLLNDGELDFAFVDEFKMNANIAIEPVYNEVLHLCSSHQLIPKKSQLKLDKDFFEQLSYVDYEPGEPVARLWFKHHFGTHNIRLNVRAVGLNARGISKMILSGLGAGILPGHLVQELQKKGIKIFIFQGKGTPLHNNISLAFLRDKTRSHAEAVAIEWLRKALSAQCSS